MSLTYCHPYVLILISCGLIPIPIPSFVAPVVLLEIYPNFLANLLRSPPRPLLAVIALGVQYFVRRSVCEVVPPVLSGIFAIC